MAYLKGDRSVTVRWGLGDRRPYTALFTYQMRAVGILLTIPSL